MSNTSENRKYFQANGQPPTVPYMLAFGVKLVAQVVFQTMLLFLILWMSLVHKRWENFRYFMIRNYAPDSLIFLSGFMIIFGFIVTTLGRGFEIFLPGVGNSLNIKKDITM